MNSFIIRLILSFFIGAIWITLLSVFAEKKGTKIGGAIAGIPATMVVALFFIGLTQTPEIASKSTTIIPLILGINALFVVIFVGLSRVNFGLAFFSSLILWFNFAFILNQLNFNNFLFAIFAYIILIIFSYHILEKKLNIRSQEKKKIEYNPVQIIFRALISGFVVSFAVLMAKVGGPTLGGIFATFPALTIALILITHFTHGKSFSSALLKNFVIAGTINVLVFIIAIRYTYIFIGLYAGTFIALLVSLFSAYITYHLINKKMN